MGFIVWMIVSIVEISFLVWSYVTGEKHEKEKETARIALALIMAVLLATGVLQGFMRYGMLFVILVIQSLIGAIKIMRKKEKPLRKGLRTAGTVGCILLYLFCLTPAFVFPQHKDIPVTGGHEVVNAEYTWIDENRIETFTDTGENRQLTVKFWYPKEEGKYPLVVFSHGSFGIIDSNYSTCNELASNGYVVVSIGHTYHSMFVKNTGGEMFIISPEFLKQVYEGNGTDDPEMERVVYDNSREFMKVRTGDENFVLDTILSKVQEGEEAPFSYINADKIGLFGHSMGGATSVQIGRERDDIDAVIDMEGTMFGEYVGFENGTEIFNEEPYPIPVLDMNSSYIDEAARTLPGQGYVNFYLGKNAVDYHYEVIQDAGHLNYTDLPIVSPVLAKMLTTNGYQGMGKVDPRQCIQQINGIVLDFFDTYLKE